MKQSQGLGLLRFARNDCKYFCRTTWGESSEAAINRHTTAKKVALGKFQKNFLTLYPKNEIFSLITHDDCLFTSISKPLI